MADLLTELNFARGYVGALRICVDNELRTMTRPIRIVQNPDGTMSVIPSNETAAQIACRDASAALAAGCAALANIGDPMFVDVAIRHFQNAVKIGRDFSDGPMMNREVPRV